MWYTIADAALMVVQVASIVAIFAGGLLLADEDI